MSGTPKYCEAELDQQRREQLERQRRRQAAEEARRRQEAEEYERRRQLEGLRSALTADLNRERDRLRSREREMHSEEAGSIDARCKKVVSDIRGASSENSLRRQERELRLLGREISEAIARKRRDDEAAKRVAELEMHRFQIDEIERRRTELSDQDVAKFDPKGAIALTEAIGKARTGIAAGDSEASKPLVKRAEDTFRKHHDDLNARREEWLRQRNEATQAIADARTHIQGLLADPVLVRWHHQSVLALESLVAKANGAIASERFKDPPETLAHIQRQSVVLISEANHAQEKADKRDYIVDSIKQTLESMNFAVSPAWQEHAGHPASAMLLEAATASNKKIFVSVPVEGKVMYTVDGYAMTTEAVTGGGSSRTCDAAEQVLTEMQATVEASYGVKMGEIWWESKEPNRNLRIAKDLPRGVHRKAQGHK